MKTALRCIQDFITTEPILKYPDPNLPYNLYTDSSKYTWSGILTQKQMVDLPNGSQHEIEVQITQQSSTYAELQEKWSTIKKEAYAIYASFKKMIFYLKKSRVKEEYKIGSTINKPKVLFCERFYINAGFNSS